MFNKLTSFPLLLIYISLSKIKSQELCQSFTYYGYFVEEQNCPAYCCGNSCNDRYCCNDVSQRLDQSKCLPDNCNAYYDQWSYQPDVNCGDEFCCGSCDSRFCCSIISLKLNQSECPALPKTTTTTPFYSSSSTTRRSSSTTNRFRTTTYYIIEDSITA